MKFRELRFDDMPQLLRFRAQYPESLRTAFPLTLEQQQAWYQQVVCNRSANARYWGIEIQKKFTKLGFGALDEEKPVLIGMGGVENIQDSNRLAEMSLLIDINWKHLQRDAAIETLREGFNRYNLENIYTEDYECSRDFQGWLDFSNEFKARIARLPNRKFWDGKYYDSMYANFNREEFFNVINNP